MKSVRIYVDEDPSQELATRLSEVGHEAASTTELGNKGRTDQWQLAFAAREKRILVTCNVRDFSMLHDAWSIWSNEWGVADQVRHAGILLIPQKPSATEAEITGAIDE